jgi:hypothetical protein
VTPFSPSGIQPSGGSRSPQSECGQNEDLANISTRCGYRLTSRAMNTR